MPKYAHGAQSAGRVILAEDLGNFERRGQLSFAFGRSLCLGFGGGEMRIKRDRKSLHADTIATRYLHPNPFAYRGVRVIVLPH
jgi:hypothetical protein